MFDRCLKKRYDQVFAVIDQQLNTNVIKYSENIKHLKTLFYWDGTDNRNIKEKDMRI